MEWLRRETNPWGQEIIIGLDWDLIWLAVAAGILIIAGHWLVYYWRWRVSVCAADTTQEPRSQGLPGRVLRHSLPSRMFHWVMAVCSLVLLLTAFLPILGLKFPWLTPHWIAGFLLTAAVIFHIIHASFWKGLNLMWIGRADIKEAWHVLKQIFGSFGSQTAKPGKNPFENKLFHHLVSVSTLATIITGLIMMAKVDTPWWERNPYVLSDDAWGMIYVMHGAGSVALIALVMAHLYFAVRPEKRWITLSMIFGWIPPDRYLQNYDPSRWPVAPETGGETASFSDARREKIREVETQ